jgi:hypothetical protein
MAWKSFSDIVGRRAGQIVNSNRHQVRVALILAAAENALKKQLGAYAQELKPKMLKGGVLTFVSHEAPALAELRLRETLVVAEINRSVGYTAVVRLAYNVEILPKWQ